MKSEKAIEILDIFLEATNTLYNAYLKESKDNGGRITGYTCSYMPEEMISAAGSIPFRLRGKRNIDLESVDRYMGPFGCTYVSHFLETAMGDGLDFLDGMVFVNTCDHMRRIFDNIKRFKTSQYAYILDVPKKREEPEIELFRGELEGLKRELEAQYCVKITDDRLWEAVKLHNETRSLQKELYNLRKLEYPPITGAQTLAVMVAGTSMPKEIYNRNLRELIHELGREKDCSTYKARLMVVGSALDDPEYFNVIEDTGGLIVTDSICHGTRVFWNTVDESGNDPLLALARYYIGDRPSCPHSIGQTQRSEYIKQMKEDFAVDGIIGVRLKFCELWGFEHHLLQNAFREADIPFLSLETEYKLGAVGQLRTRVQAFLEVIEGSKP
ncbi:MAG: 2-hydroxyacyl-CoA dehydratase subunit D [bacterium]